MTHQEIHDRLGRIKEIAALNPGTPRVVDLLCILMADIQGRMENTKAPAESPESGDSEAFAWPALAAALKDAPWVDAIQTTEQDGDFSITRRLERAK